MQKGAKSLTVCVDGVHTVIPYYSVYAQRRAQQVNDITQHVRQWELNQGHVMNYIIFKFAHDRNTQ